MYSSIDGNVYSKDKKTLTIYAPGKIEKSFTIPSSVTSIGDYAFRECTGLRSIVIPSSITDIGNFAFFDCTNLKTVYYDSTAEKWSAITIDPNNTNLTDATRYYYSETQPAIEDYYWHYVNGVPRPW
jgi:hypothetical protein